MRASDSTPPSPPPWARVSQQEFAAAVAALPVHLRVVFELHALHRLSYDELAVRLEIDRADVATRLLRARVLLKDMLMDLVGGDETA